jgi:hypothetical protein
MLDRSLILLRKLVRDIGFIGKCIGHLTLARVPSVRDYLEYRAADEEPTKVEGDGIRRAATYTFMGVFPILLPYSVYFELRMTGTVRLFLAVLGTVIFGVVVYGAKCAASMVFVAFRERAAFGVADWWAGLFLLVLHLISLVISCDLLLSVADDPTGSRMGPLGRLLYQNDRWNAFVHQFAVVGRLATGMLCLVILMIGIRWQASTFLGDALTRQRRMKWALIVAGGCLSGAATWAIFATTDLQSGMTSVDSAKFVASVGIISAIFLFKTWLGPILLTTTLSWSIYWLFMHGELSLLPLFGIITKTFLHFAPNYVSQIYTILTLVFSMFGSLYSTMNAFRGPLDS